MTLVSLPLSLWKVLRNSKVVRRCYEPIEAPKMAAWQQCSVSSEEIIRIRYWDWVPTVTVRHTQISVLRPFLRKRWSSWLINFFKDMIERGDLDTSNPMQMEFLWFSFSKVIERELNQVKNDWNSHYIRGSKYQTMPGIPDKLYFFPEDFGTTDHKHLFDAADQLEAEYEISCTPTDANASNSEENESTDYFLYFNYALDTLGMDVPNDWREGLSTYHRLLSVAI